MPKNTPNLNLYKVDGETDGSDTFNVDVVLNDNWDKIDAAIKSVEDAVGDISVPDASLTKKGITMLSNATDGTREDVAPTEKALGLVMKEAQAGKQAGIDRKAEVVAALNSIGVTASTSETWEQLIPKIAAVIRATGNATAADVLAGKIFSNATGNTIAGAMANQGAVTNTITSQNGSYTIPAGYHNGTGKVTALFANLIASNIRKDINIGNVIGTLVEGRKSATGAIVSSMSNLRFNGPKLGAASKSYVLVSGLTFDPDCIIVLQMTSGAWIVYKKGINFYGETGADIIAGYISTPSTEQSYAAAFFSSGANAGDAYVNSLGFRLPAYSGNTTHIWIAIGA